MSCCSLTWLALELTKSLGLSPETRTIYDAWSHLTYLTEVWRLRLSFKAEVPGLRPRTTEAYIALFGSWRMQSQSFFFWILVLGLGAGLCVLCVVLCVNSATATATCNLLSPSLVSRPSFVLLATRYSRVARLVIKQWIYGAGTCGMRQYDLRIRCASGGTH